MLCLIFFLFDQHGPGNYGMCTLLNTNSKSNNFFTNNKEGRTNEVNTCRIHLLYERWTEKKHK